MGGGEREERERAQWTINQLEIINYTRVLTKHRNASNTVYMDKQFKLTVHPQDS